MLIDNLVAIPAEGGSYRREKLNEWDKLIKPNGKATPLDWLLWVPSIQSKLGEYSTVCVGILSVKQLMRAHRN